MSENSNLKVAVMGVGHMGSLHARVYSQLEKTTLIGICDADRTTAEKISQSYGCKIFSSPEEAVEQVDAVSIATPTMFHFDVAKLFLSKGKHVLIEKPITNTAEEAYELVKIAQENECVLQVGHIERFNPVLTALEERLTRPRFIEAHRLSPYPGRSTDIGVIMDLMIHDIEIILHLVNSPVKSVEAVGVPVLSKAEDIANARIRFENGCIANITTSRISPEKLRKIRVFQDDAYLSLDYQKQTGEIYRKIGEQIIREAIPVIKDEPLKRELESFADCCLQRRSPLVSGMHAARALQLATEISRQVRELDLPAIA
jgi:predicted dehydrogenase